MNDSNNKSVNEFFLVNLFFLVELSYGGKALLGTLKFFNYVAFTQALQWAFWFFVSKISEFLWRADKQMSRVGGERGSIARLKSSLAKHTNACTRARISITLLALHHRRSLFWITSSLKSKGTLTLSQIYNWAIFIHEEPQEVIFLHGIWRHIKEFGIEGQIPRISSPVKLEKRC